MEVPKRVVFLTLRNFKKLIRTLPIKSFRILCCTNYIAMQTTPRRAAFGIHFNRHVAFLKEIKRRILNEPACFFTLQMNMCKVALLNCDLTDEEDSGDDD